MSIFNALVKGSRKDQKRAEDDAASFIRNYQSLCKTMGYHIGAEIDYSPQGITAKPVVVKTKRDSDDLPDAPEQI